MATVDLMDKALAALTDVNASVTDVVDGLLSPGEVTEPLGISEVAALLDVSAHTLRYYERCGLIDVARDSNDHRSENEGLNLITTFGVIPVDLIRQRLRGPDVLLLAALLLLWI